MGGQLHLSQGSTIEIFCVPKQTIESQGWLIGIGIDRDMKNWDFSKTVKLFDDWTTFEIIIQDRHWTQWENVTATDAISLRCNEFNIDEIQALRKIYFYLLEYCFLLDVARGSEHRPNKRITSTIQKQINKKILKEQTEPQTYNYTLIVKITPAGNHTTEQTENVWQ